ncbi:MAG: DUF4406 domain-containing protein [archaeon]
MKLLNKEPKKVYISGPMSGLPNNNYEAFFTMEDRLKKAGYEIVNPARMSQNAINSGHKNPTRQDFYRQDFKALCDCDAIILLDGWVHSHGARFERQLAVEIGCQVFHEDELRGK